MVCVVAVALAASAGRAQPSELDRAHAHNDYLHDRPLVDALEAGFNSVEVDVHLVNGDLLVGHDQDDVTPERTLESLYLAPLREVARQNGGRIHAGRPPLLLLVDVKSEAVASYERLDRVLRSYADILSIYAGDATVEGAVSVVISGARAHDTMRAAPIRFAAIDGRLPDLDRASDLPSAFMPLVSERWGRVTDWAGVGAPPEELTVEVARRVDQAHAQGRRLRFWGTPENEAVWRFLRDAGVDLINTDDLQGMRAFLLGGTASCRP